MVEGSLEKKNKIKKSFTCNRIRIAGSACCRSSAHTCSPLRPPWSGHPPKNGEEIQDPILYKKNSSVEFDSMLELTN